MPLWAERDAEIGVGARLCDEDEAKINVRPADSTNICQTRDIYHIMFTKIVSHECDAKYARTRGHKQYLEQ